MKRKELFDIALPERHRDASGAFRFRLIILASVSFLGRLSAAVSEDEILGAILHDTARRFF